MTNVMTDSAALATLADIEFPAPPEWRPVILFALAVLVVTAALVGLWCSRRSFRRPNSAVHAEQLPPRAQALERLAALRQGWESGMLDDRETGFRMCAVLRLGLGLPQLRAATPPGPDESLRWLSFVEELRQIRYRPRQSGLTSAHFDQARDWLSGTPVTRDLAGV